MRFSHVTRLHIVTSFCLEIWRFLSEAINTRFAYVANYIKKSVADATVAGLLVLLKAKRYPIELRIINEFVWGILVVQMAKGQIRIALQRVLDG